MIPTALLIRPARFGLHEAAASSNPYITSPDDTPSTIHEQAFAEFNALADALADAGVDTLILDERERHEEPCPDAVFPNNWFSLHAGTLVLYPMRDEARRRERWGNLRERLEIAGVRIDRVIDLTHHETEGRYLEGTGSLVFDPVEPMVYAARSPRTDEGLVRELATTLDVEPVVLDATDIAGGAVYHTNVLMSVARTYAIACLERVVGDADRGRLRSALTVGGRTLVDITPAQMDDYCANALELPTRTGGTVLALSERAHNALTNEQRRALKEHTPLVSVPIPTIERVGGGSVRCMIARL